MGGNVEKEEPTSLLAAKLFLEVARGFRGRQISVEERHRTKANWLQSAEWWLTNLLCLPLVVFWLLPCAAILAGRSQWGLVAIVVGSIPLAWLVRTALRFALIITGQYVLPHNN